MAYPLPSCARKATQSCLFRSLKIHFFAGTRPLSTVGVSPVILPWSPLMMLPPVFDDKSDCRFFSFAKERVIRFKKKDQQYLPDDYRFFSVEKKQLIKIKQDTPDNNAKCVGSSHGWLALINPRDCALFLSDPISGQNISLPPIKTLPCMCDGRFFETRAPHDWSDFIIEKLVISSSPHDNNCMVMVINGYNNELAFCRPGDMTWTGLDDDVGDGGGPLSNYVQVLYSCKDRLFYALTENEEFVAWDLRNPSAPKKYEYRIDDLSASIPAKSEEERDIKKNYCERRGYLAVQPLSGELMYIRRYFAHIGEDHTIVPGDATSTIPYQTLFLDVFKIDLGKKLAKYVNCLDDYAFFIGLNQSFCLSAKEFPELEPNSIYFTDDLFIHYPPHDRGQDMGTYDLGDNTCENLFSPSFMKKIQSPTVWFTPYSPWKRVSRSHSLGGKSTK